jgi:hypothetical protein
LFKTKFSIWDVSPTIDVSSTIEVVGEKEIRNDFKKK